MSEERKAVSVMFPEEDENSLIEMREDLEKEIRRRLDKEEEDPVIVLDTLSAAVAEKEDEEFKKHLEDITKGGFKVETGDGSNISPEEVDRLTAKEIDKANDEEECEYCNCVDCICGEPEEPQKEITIGNVFQNQWQRVEYWELKMAMFQAIIRDLRQGAYGMEDKTLSEAFQVIYGKLWQEVGQAYKDLFMMATFSDPEDLERAKELAYKEFFKENYSLAHLLNKTGMYHGMGNANDEQALRKAIKERVEQGKEEE